MNLRIGIVSETDYVGNVSGRAGSSPCSRRLSLGFFMSAQTGQDSLDSSGSGVGGSPSWRGWR